MTLLLAMLLAAPAPKVDAKEPPKLEGSWTLVKTEGVDKGDEKAATLTITGDKLVVLENGRDKGEEATFTVDWKKSPAEFDIKPTTGPKDIVIPAIIEVKGDTMRLCFPHGGMGVRPKGFDADAASNQRILTLERVKDK